MGIGVYGKGMHDFILMEVELGTRTAMIQDAEENDGLGVPPAIFDLQYEAWVRRHEKENNHE